MGDEYRDYWRRAGNPDALKAYGDGYADGRCFEAPISEERGMRIGVAVYAGLLAMAEAIGEMMPPLVPPEPRRRPDGLAEDLAEWATWADALSARYRWDQRRTAAAKTGEPNE